MMFNFKVPFTFLVALLFTSISYAATVKTTVNLTNNNSSAAYYAKEGTAYGPPVPYQHTMKQFDEKNSTSDQCWLGQVAAATYEYFIFKFNDPGNDVGTSICYVVLNINYCDNFGSLEIKKSSSVYVSSSSCGAVWKHSKNPGSLNITVN